MELGDKISIGIDFETFGGCAKVCVFRNGPNDSMVMIGEFDVAKNEWKTKEELEQVIGAKIAENLEYGKPGEPVKVLGRFAPEEVTPDSAEDELLGMYADEDESIDDIMDSNKYFCAGDPIDMMALSSHPDTRSLEQQIKEAKDNLYLKMAEPETIDEILSRGFVTYDETKPLNFKLHLTTLEIEKRKEEGRCPQCGELGRFINLAPTCSKHGVY